MKSVAFGSQWRKAAGDRGLAVHAVVCWYRHTYCELSSLLLLLFLRAGVQPTLDPYNRPIALIQEGWSQVHDVRECVHD